MDFYWTTFSPDSQRKCTWIVEAKFYFDVEMCRFRLQQEKKAEKVE